MTETAGTYANTYYYHFDALGCVTALSDANGTTVEVYEYDVYGQVAASDPNHPNPFLFTGRRFDTETGLYYYRARYYNASIGRFLQTDPIGYGDGMNMYAYCGNNATNCTDPSGLASFGFLDLEDENDTTLTFGIYRDDGSLWRTFDYASVEEWTEDVMSGAFDRFFTDEWKEDQAADTLAGEDEVVFWALEALTFLCSGADSMLEFLADNGVSVRSRWRPGYDPGANTVYWSPTATTNSALTGSKDWYEFHPLASLGHELHHAFQDFTTYKDKDYRRGGEDGTRFPLDESEPTAVQQENLVRWAVFNKVPWLTKKGKRISVRPGWSSTYDDQSWDWWLELEQGGPNWVPPF